MLIQVRRTLQNKVSTAGEMLIDQKPMCKTLEDAWHVAKQDGRTRIPAGLYPVGLRTESPMSERYGERFPDMHSGMIWIKEVPWFEYVYIHIGNDPDDTRGCILVGMEVVEPERPEQPYTLHSSEAAYRLIYPVVSAAFKRNEKVWFQAIEPDHGAWWA